MRKTIPEDERIYLNVSYEARDAAKYMRCGFDSEKKLWFVGSKNFYLSVLVTFYGVNEATSERAMQLLGERVEDYKVVYLNAGKKYHYSASCAGNAAYASTLKQARKQMKEPCSKCVQ